jgi:hypothetical protein
MRKPHQQRPARQIPQPVPGISHPPRPRETQRGELSSAHHLVFGDQPQHLAVGVGRPDRLLLADA